MLILSRRPGQHVVFPELGISVGVLDNRGSKVRLGIKAPDWVHVVREELLSETPGDRAERPDLGRQLRHWLRGQLNSVCMALHLAESQIDSGLVDDAVATLRTARQSVENLSPPDRDRDDTPQERSPRALVVEDNVNEESLLSCFLKLNGFVVESAHDGFEALERLASEPLPHAVLLDMRLPRIDGPTVIERIRGEPQWQELRIYGVSGALPEDYGLHTGADGVDGWFRKPVDPQQIVRVLKRELTVAP